MIRSQTSFRQHWHLYLMATIYSFAGVNHFVSPEFYLKVMPTWIPEHSLMVILSGIAEIVLALLLIWPLTRKLAAWGIIALLIAVSPVHLYMIQEHETLFAELPIWALYARLPLQLLFILWAYHYTKKAGHVSRYV